jgi:hypothetical protein
MTWNSRTSVSSRARSVAAMTRARPPSRISHHSAHPTATVKTHLDHAIAKLRTGTRGCPHRPGLRPPTHAVVQRVVARPSQAACDLLGYSVTHGSPADVGTAVVSVVAQHQ